MLKYVAAVLWLLKLQILKVLLLIKRDVLLGVRLKERMLVVVWEKRVGEGLVSFVC